MQEGPEGEASRREVGARMSAQLYPEWNSYGVAMGYRYDDSPIVVPDGTPATEDDPSKYVQTARPGHRAPHGWLDDGRSTIDLFGRSFVLLRFHGEADPSPLLDAAAGGGLPVEVVDVRSPELSALYERRLVLVRPDGHVAWRGDELPGAVGEIVDRVRGASPV
jgi:hypothetical protein